MSETPEARSPRTAGRPRWVVTGASCNAGKGERIARGAVALFLAAFAISTVSTSVLVAIVAGVLAVGVGVMAVTGFCPDDWLRLRALRSHGENSAGYEDMSHVLEIGEQLGSAEADDGRGRRRR